MPIAGPAFRVRSPLRLAEDEVQVWSANLDELAAAEDYWFSLLSSDEQERAQRFRFPVHRSRFAVGRGLLRTLLAGYLSSDARRLRFQYAEKGKPSLGKEFSGSLQFNISHAEEIALFAFTIEGNIGVDVEKVRRNIEVKDLAQRFFSASERKALAALPESQKYEAFFNCWTRKEAFIKALGEGLSHPLDSFDVSLAPGQPAALLATRPDAREKDHWCLRALDAGPDCRAAVVVWGHKPRVALAPVTSILNPQPS